MFIFSVLTSFSLSFSFSTQIESLFIFRVFTSFSLFQIIHTSRNLRKLEHYGQHQYVHTYWLFTRSKKLVRTPLYFAVLVDLMLNVDPDTSTTVSFRALPDYRIFDRPSCLAFSSKFCLKRRHFDYFFKKVTAKFI